MWRGREKLRWGGGKKGGGGERKKFVFMPPLPTQAAAKLKLL